eukprot:381978_1
MTINGINNPIRNIITPIQYIQSTVDPPMIITTIPSTEGNPLPNVSCILFRDSSDTRSTNLVQKTQQIYNNGSIGNNNNTKTPIIIMLIFIQLCA